MTIKEFTTIRIKKSLHQKIKKLADDEKRTILAMIEILVDDRETANKGKK